MNKRRKAEKHLLEGDVYVCTHCIWSYEKGCYLAGGGFISDPDYIPTDYDFPTPQHHYSIKEGNLVQYLGVEKYGNIYFCKLLDLTKGKVTYLLNRQKTRLFSSKEFFTFFKPLK